MPATVSCPCCSRKCIPSCTKHSVRRFGAPSRAMFGLSFLAMVYPFVVLNDQRFKSAPVIVLPALALSLAAKLSLWIPIAIILPISANRSASLPLKSFGPAHGLVDDPGGGAIFLPV